VLELHCYAVPDDVPDGEVAALLVAEAARFFPEIAPGSILHQHVEIADDFTAFHVGAARTRPEVRTSLRELVLAGDWVATPLPAMLMEAAYSAGLLAANAVLVHEGLREHLVYTVPLAGVLAPRPAREISTTISSMT
jgi:carotenoid phi-ring synthase / carotenoid chi-ring synthase